MADYICGDWDRPLNMVLLLLVLNFVCGFILELQVKPHSSPWFLAACAAAVSYRNHFFHLHQQNDFFPFITYLKPLDIYVTPKVVRKVIANPDL